MNERQYRQILRNRKRRDEPHYAGGAADALLRDAARDARQRRSAEAAWRLIAPDILRSAARVGCVRDGIVWLDAPDPVSRERLRRQLGALTAQMRMRVPGVSAVRVSPVDGAAEREEGLD